VDAFLAWTEENWISLIQCAGIVGGLIFTALSIRRDTKARRMSDLLSLSKLHRDLWSEVHRRPELSRVMDTETDLVGCPVTAAEEAFLFVVITHFHTGWHLARNGALLSLNVLAEDAGWFFSLPIPKAVWAESKSDRDQKFVQFVEASTQKRARMDKKGK